MTNNRGQLRKVEEVAHELGIEPGRVVPYGRFKAKVEPTAVGGAGGRGDLVLVSAITPTKAGEGKTTVSVGLADGLRRLGAKVALRLREPSLGPVFGIKGGGGWRLSRCRKRHTGPCGHHTGSSVAAGSPG